MSISLVCFFLGFIFLRSCECDHTDNPVTVSTYSLWNLRFNWDVRKLRIAQMIRELAPDVVAFQDVRGSNLDVINPRSQIADIQKLLPVYSYSDFHPLNKVKYHRLAYLHYGWEMEGLGIISKHPIIRSSKHDLHVEYYKVTQANTHQRKIKPGKRRFSALQYHLGVRGVGTINLLVTQLPANDELRCQCVAKLMQHITDERLHHVIIMGDFNIHNRAGESSIQAMTKFNTYNTSCHSYLEGIRRMDNNLFMDAWAATYSRENGYTFRNLVSSKEYISRPDRILASQYAVQSVVLTGDGKVYASKFYVHLILHRFWTIISASRDTSNDYQGYSCIQDCDPNASCRCGVCVPGEQTCYLPNCRECLSSTLMYFYFAAFSIVLCSLSCIHAILRGLLILNSFHNYDLRTKLGFNCCLCHPELYAPEMGTYARKIRLSSAFRFASCYLPPFQHLIVSFLGFLATLFIWRLVFTDVVELTFNIPDVEFYPSDHLMVTGKLLLHPAKQDNII